MSVPSVTLTLLASLLIIGCASKEQHPPSLEDSHGFKPTAAYQGGTISETQPHLKAQRHPWRPDILGSDHINTAVSARN